MCSAIAAAQASTPLAHVETKGSGETSLVLIPGLACDWSVWDEFMERNSGAYTMYAVTLPGFAGTEAPALDEPGSDADGEAQAQKAASDTPLLDNAVEGIKQLIAEKKLDDVIIIGHSLGGTLALRIGAEGTEHVAGVVSVDGFAAMPLQPTPTPLDQRKMIVETMLAPQFKTVTQEMWDMQQDAGSPAMVTDAERAKELAVMTKKTKAQTGMAYMLDLLRTDVTGPLKGMKIPGLIIAGDASGQSERLGTDVESIWKQQVEGSGVGLVMVPESKHFVMFDAPAEFDRLISGFAAKAAGQESEASKDTRDNTEN